MKKKKATFIFPSVNYVLHFQIFYNQKSNVKIK